MRIKRNSRQPSGTQSRAKRQRNPICKRCIRMNITFEHIELEASSCSGSKSEQKRHSSLIFYEVTYIRSKSFFCFAADGSYIFSPLALPSSVHLKTVRSFSSPRKMYAAFTLYNCIFLRSDGRTGGRTNQPTN